MALHPSVLLSSTRVLDYEPFVQKMCSQTFVLDLGLNTFPSRFFFFFFVPSFESVFNNFGL